MTNNHTHYWFAPPGDKLGYGDGRIAKVGETHTVEGELDLCRHGLHMCKTPIFALAHAQSTVIFGVSPGDNILKGGDLICSNCRTYHWRLDCSDILAVFARWCALEVAHLWDMPDVVRRFLETGNEELRSDAARAAAYAAYAAAYAAARAARAAAYAVARAGAAGADMRAKQNAKLEQMILEKLADTRSKGIGR